MSEADKIFCEVFFHHREKAECALSACSMWYGGDYFEFGSHDLATFRNMLTAYDVCALTRRISDVRFYAFDVFGDDTGVDEEFRRNYCDYLKQGNQLKQHEAYLDQHGLFRDRCYLVQGLFQNTLTPEFKKRYLDEKRGIGFAFLDCNMESSYETVFDYIWDMMNSNAYIYIDEYFQSSEIIRLFDAFMKKLHERRNLRAIYMRNAGGFGALFRIVPC